MISFPLAERCIFLPSKGMEGSNTTRSSALSFAMFRSRLSTKTVNSTEFSEVLNRRIILAQPFSAFLDAVITIFPPSPDIFSVCSAVGSFLSAWLG